MPHEGRKINTKQALALCYDAGFRGTRLITAVAVMNAESARYTRAYYVNPDGSIDRGLFQINSRHNLSEYQAFDARTNVNFASALSHAGRDFTPWVAWKNSKHLQFIPTVTAVWALGEWRALTGGKVVV